MVGTDFIEKSKRGFDKYLDRQRAALATSDLFTRQIGDMCQSFAADIQGNAAIEVGEALHAEAAGSQLILTRDLRVIAVVADPPASVMQAVQDSCGIATALVQEVHGFAGTIEVTLC